MRSRHCMLCVHALKSTSTWSRHTSRNLNKYCFVVDVVVVVIVGGDGGGGSSASFILHVFVQASSGIDVAAICFRHFLSLDLSHHRMSLNDDNIYPPRIYCCTWFPKWIYMDKQIFGRNFSMPTSSTSLHPFCFALWRIRSFRLLNSGWSCVSFAFCDCHTDRTYCVCVWAGIYIAE